MKSGTKRRESQKKGRDLGISFLLLFCLSSCLFTGPIESCPITSWSCLYASKLARLSSASLRIPITFMLSTWAFKQTRCELKRIFLVQLQKVLWLETLRDNTSRDKTSLHHFGMSCISKSPLFCNIHHFEAYTFLNIGCLL